MYFHVDHSIYFWTVRIGFFFQMLVVPVLGLWVQRQSFKTIWWKVPGEIKLESPDRMNRERIGQDKSGIRDSVMENGTRDN